MKAENGTINVLLLLLFCAALVACERDYNIELKDNQPQLVVEGYINNEMPLYNYVILSKSKSFYEPGFQNIPVSGAIVTVTEGVRLPDNTYQWDETAAVRLKEARPPQLGNQPVPGFYFDPRLATADSANALKGIPGKYYRLDIETEGKRYAAITALPVPVPIDSLSVGYYFTDIIDDKKQDKARITIHYKDPDTIGNTQLYFWRHGGGASKNFGWGTFGMSEYAPGTDDQVNGQDIHLTLSYGFVIGETVSIIMTSVERKVYNFWDSFIKAGNNNGPFATPVTLQSNITGDNVTGCFSGFATSSKTIVVK